ncbi:MAG: hypothetical protein ACKVX9_01685 [Blastocatellia bacterium]
MTVTLDQISVETAQVLISQAAAGTENLPPRPLSYSREDIYFDHD